jgi:hypothetical protein
MATDKSKPLPSEAEGYLRDGIKALGIAFNLSRSRPWLFDVETQNWAGCLLKKLVDAFFDGNLRAIPVASLIEPRPRDRDPAFATFMNMLTVQAKCAEACAAAYARRKKAQRRRRPS